MEEKCVLAKKQKHTVVWPDKKSIGSLCRFDTTAQNNLPVKNTSISYRLLKGLTLENKTFKILPVHASTGLVSGFCFNGLRLTFHTSPNASIHH